MMPALHPKMS